MSNLGLIGINISQPNRLKKFPWRGHLVFAQWIIAITKPKILVELGTHYGDSYFAFCQSVHSNGLSTQCHAVDTWQGDPQAGFYEDDVYESVSTHNDENYCEFSTLHRCTFDDALSNFEDNSIDLLHIDGYHTYEAVKHDFETWKPKLTKNAVVLFHDTAEGKDNFGVWRFWEELAEQYKNSSFLFYHSHGLGVLGVGDNYPEELKELFTSDGSKTAYYRDFFEKLNRYLVVPKEDILLNKNNMKFNLYLNTGNGLSEKEKESSNADANATESSKEGRQKYFISKYSNLTAFRADFGVGPKLVYLSNLRLTKKDGSYVIPSLTHGTYSEKVCFDSDQCDSGIFLFTEKFPRINFKVESGDYISFEYNFKILGINEVTNCQQVILLGNEIEKLNKAKSEIEKNNQDLVIKLEDCNQDLVIKLEDCNKKLDQIDKLETELLNTQQKLEKLHILNSKNNQKLVKLKKSFSWRITYPLRVTLRLITFHYFRKKK